MKHPGTHSTGITTRELVGIPLERLKFIQQGELDARIMIAFAKWQMKQIQEQPWDSNNYMYIYKYVLDISL